MLLLIFALAVAGQQPPGEEAPVFRAGVSLVRVDAQVVANRQPVQGLGKEDFVVLDNGAPQTIEYFGRETEPLRIVLVLDVSGSMGRRLTEIAGVARQALSSLKPEDQVAVMLFSREVKVAQGFTANPQEAAPAIQQAPREKGLGSASRINEAIIEAANYLGEKTANQAGRRSIVILTDNQGLAYQVPDEAVLRALFKANATLNPIVTPDARPPAAPKPGQYLNPDFTPHDVFKLARETGGAVLKAQDAGRSFQEVLDRLRTRYSLHYRPPAAPAGSARTIKVELSAAARSRYPKAEVRARTGYLSGH